LINNINANSTHILYNYPFIINIYKLDKKTWCLSESKIKYENQFKLRILMKFLFSLADVQK